MSVKSPRPIFRDDSGLTGRCLDVWHTSFGGPLWESVGNTDNKRR